MSHKDVLEQEELVAALQGLPSPNREGNWHVPQPGDPDYLTPEQVSWIKAGRDDEDGPTHPLVRRGRAR